MTPGTRVRVIGGPWQERIGCEGTIVAPPADGTYPQPPASERVVLLDDDPVIDRYANEAFSRWTMCIGTKDLVAI